MNKEEYNKFIERLRYHNKGEGVRRHITAHPIFSVQQCVRDYDCDESAYDYHWIDEDDHECIMDDEEVVIDLQKNNQHKVAQIRIGYKHGDWDELDDDDKEDLINEIYTKVYYKERWEHVNSHLTKEGAEAFISRKSHSYEPMRVFVDSQYLCWEFNDVIKALLNGDIAWKEDK